MYNNSANEMLMGGGIPSLKFESIGTAFSGIIAMQPEVLQQRDFTTGELLTWDDGNPRQQIKVVLETDERDPADAYDDGQRAVFIKSGLMKAVRTAIRTAGAKGLEVGGKLTIRYVGDGEPPKRGMHPPKQYTAVYEAPSAPAAVDANALLNGMSTAGQAAYEAASTTPTAPAPQQPVAPAAQPGGLPDHPAFAQLSAEQRAALAQIGSEQRRALGYPA